MPLIRPLASPRTMLAFDIESGSVAAGIVASGGDEPARVLIAKRIALTDQDRSEAQLAAAIVQALATAGKEVIEAYAASGQKGHGAIHDVHAVLHAPWAQSMTHDAHVTLDAPGRITEALIERAGKEATHAAGIAADSRTIFERTVMRVELNGYPTALPVGKTADDIRVVILESTISAAFLKSVTDTLATLAPGRAPQLHSAMLTYTTVVHRLLAHDSSYTFLDIGNEASAASVVRSGSLMQQGTVPAGLRSLILSASKEANQPIDGTYSLIRMIAEGTCNDAQCESLEAALSAAEPAFIRSVGEVFSAMIAGSRLPNQLVIAIDPDMALWAERFFARIDFGQFTLTGQPFAVQVISTALLTDLVRFAPGTSADTGVAILAALVHIRYA